MNLSIQKTYLLNVSMLLMLSGLAACSPSDSHDETSEVQAIDISQEANETASQSKLTAIALNHKTNQYIDIRGVGDSAWSDTHSVVPRSARFGAALDGFDASGLSYRGDISYLNWETVIGDRCSAFSAPFSPGQSYAFVSRPENLAQAYAKGFNLIGLSNNHSRDCNLAQGSEDGVAMSLRLMQSLDTSAQWLWHGIAENKAQKHEPAIRSFHIKGQVIRIAFASIYNGRANCKTANCASDELAVLTGLRDAEADFRILAIHSQGSQAGLVNMGRRFIRDFSGDLVFGSGPHVMQAVRVVKKSDGRRGVMFESLGNFIHPGLGSQLNNIIGRVLIDPATFAISQIQVLPISTSAAEARLKGSAATLPKANVNWSRNAEIKGAFANLKQDSSLE